MKAGFFSAICVLLLLALCVSGCEKKTPNNNDKTDTPTAEAATDAFLKSADVLAEGVYIEEVFSYTGAYVEDGSNAECENICAVRLYNGGATHYQYLKFTVTTADGVCTYAASTLFAGARMTVLCQEKTAFTSEKLLDSELLAAAEFNEPPTVHLDTLEITYTEGFINVKNLTDGPLNGVYVYYKDTDDAGFLGGITYRSLFGDIPAGGTVQMHCANMHEKTGKVVFSTYEQ